MTEENRMYSYELKGQPKLSATSSKCRNWTLHVVIDDAMYEIERGRCIRIAKDSFQKLKKGFKGSKNVFRNKEKECWTSI